MLQNFSGIGQKKFVGAEQTLPARHKSGEEFDIFLRLEEIQDDDGQWCVVAFIQEATDESVKLELLRQYVRDLEHDTRNLLSVIMGSAALLEKIKDPTYERIGKLICLASEQLLKLLEKK